MIIQKYLKKGKPGFMKNANILVETEGHQDTRDRHCVHEDVHWQSSENCFLFL